MDMGSGAGSVTFGLETYIDFKIKNIYLLLKMWDKFSRCSRKDHGGVMYSIIELNNKQYKIEKGKPVIVDKLEAGENEEIKIDKVLLYRDDKDEVKVGSPYISDLAFKAKVLGTVKGKKIRVFKYKKRKDYRRTIGARPSYTKILIEEV